jgi:hypothetical protein
MCRNFVRGHVAMITAAILCRSSGRGCLPVSLPSRSSPRVYTTPAALFTQPVCSEHNALALLLGNPQTPFTHPSRRWSVRALIASTHSWDVVSASMACECLRGIRSMDTSIQSHSSTHLKRERNTAESGIKYHHLSWPSHFTETYWTMNTDANGTNGGRILICIYFEISPPRNCTLLIFATLRACIWVATMLTIT